MADLDTLPAPLTTVEPDWPVTMTKRKAAYEGVP